MIVLVYIKKADFVCFLDRLKMCLGVNNLPDFGIRNKIRFFFCWKLLSSRLGKSRFCDVNKCGELMSEDFNGVQASLQVPGFKQLCHCHTFPDTLTKSLYSTLWPRCVSDVFSICLYFLYLKNKIFGVSTIALS